MTNEAAPAVPTRVLGSEGLWGGGDLPIARSDEAIVRHVDIAVVGGGPSGLIAAYRLKDEDILVLEAENEVGGNARVGHWNDMVWPMGAIVTYARSPAMELYDELGLTPQPTEPSYGQLTFLGNRRADEPLWEGGLEQIVPATVASSIRKAADTLRDFDLESARDGLDRRTLADILRNHRSEVVGFFDRLLAWFGGTTRSYSAYVGVHLARSQMGAGLGVLYPEGTSAGGPYTFPGGLGHATRALAQEIDGAGRDRLWTECPVHQLEQSGDRIAIKARMEGRPVTVYAKAVIVAVAKTVACKIMPWLPEEQLKSMQQFQSIPFLVTGIATTEDIAPDVSAARVLDGPFATFRKVGSSGDRRLYRCEMPLLGNTPGHRLDKSAVRTWSSDVLTRLERLFPGAAAKVEEVLVWRRGLNWYVPIPRLVTELQPKAAQPVGRASFANADSLGPISEFGWAMIAADRAVGHALQVLTD